MSLKQIYILIAMMIIGLAVQVILAPPASATIYISQATITSVNLLSGSSASSLTNFHYNISSLPGNSSVTIQFSTTSAAWYSAAGVLNSSTTLSLSATGGTDLSLSSLGLGWSGAAFYYKITLNSSSDLTQTPQVDDIRLDYTPASGFGNLFVYSNNGLVGIGFFTSH